MTKFLSPIPILERKERRICMFRDGLSDQLKISTG
jgi:hypothetical protein